MSHIFDHELGKQHILSAGGNPADFIKPPKSVLPEITNLCELENDNERASELLEYLKNINITPLIGLEYFFELAYPDSTKRLLYMCILCDKKGDLKNILGHLYSYKHIVQYFKIHFTKCFAALMPFQVKYKTNCTFVAQKIASAIEERYGRLKPHVVCMDMYQRYHESYKLKIEKGPHFSENSGVTFTNLINKDELTRETSFLNVQDSTKNFHLGDYPEVKEPEWKLKPVPDFKPNLPPLLNATHSDRSQRNNMIQARSQFPIQPKRPIPQWEERDMGHASLSYDTQLKRPKTEREEHNLNMSESNITMYNNSKLNINKELEFQKLSSTIENDMHQLFMLHQKYPEEHPEYDREWATFWQLWCEELDFIGRDPYEYDYLPEWTKWWNHRLLEMHDFEKRKKYEILLRSLGIDRKPSDNYNIEDVRPNYRSDSQASPRYNISEDVYYSNRSQSSAPLHHDDLRLHETLSPYQRSPSRERRLIRNNNIKSLLEIDVLHTQRENLYRNSSNKLDYNDYRQNQLFGQSRDHSSQRPCPPQGGMFHNEPHDLNRNFPQRSYTTQGNIKGHRSEDQLNFDNLKQYPSSSHHQSMEICSTASIPNESLYNIQNVSKENSLHRTKVNHFSRQNQSNTNQSTERGFKFLNSSDSSYNNFEHASQNIAQRSSVPGKEVYQPCDLQRYNQQANVNQIQPPQAQDQSYFNDSSRHLNSNESLLSQRTKSFNPSNQTQNRLDEVRNITIISVLSALTSLEDKLGSLGNKVVAMFSESLAMEDIKLHSSETLLNNEINCVIFELVKEKLNGYLVIGLADATEARQCTLAIEGINSLLELVEKKKRGNTNPTIEIPGVGSVPRKAIVKQIAATLIMQGKTVTQAELENLITIVVKMVGTSQMNPMATGSFIEQISSKIQSLYQKTNEPSSSIKTEKTTEAQKNSAESLSDSHIQSLLENFKSLSAQEQHVLVLHLEKMQKTQPERVEKFRRLLDLNKQCKKENTSNANINEYKRNNSQSSVKSLTPNMLQQAKQSIAAQPQQFKALPPPPPPPPPPLPNLQFSKNQLNVSVTPQNQSQPQSVNFNTFSFNPNNNNFVVASQQPNQVNRRFLGNNTNSSFY